MSFFSQAGQRVRLAALLLFLCLPELALVGYFTMGLALAFFAEGPREVDVVVVLGGAGDNRRYVLGRDLVLAGYSKRLVLIVPDVSEIKDARYKVPDAAVWADVFPRSSWGEAEATRARMEAAGWRSVMVVSDPPHMLRLRYTWGSIFRGSDMTYTLVACNPPWWPGWRWWQTPTAAGYVGDEVLKLVYYVVKYRFGS